MACLLSAGCTTQVFYQNTTGQLARVTPAMIDGTPKLEVMRITRLYGYASSNHYLDSETGIPGAKFPLYLPPGIYQFEVRCVNLNPQTIVLFYEFPEVRAKVVANGEYVIDCDMNHCDIELKVDDSKY